MIQPALPPKIITLQRTVFLHLESCRDRISCIQFLGRRYWVKQPEPFSLKSRLTKGPARRALQAERVALRLLNNRGAPVPKIALDGQDFIVLRDRGRPMADLLREPATDPDMRAELLHQSALALAQLHQSGLSHGRPFLKDIVWDGRQVTFVDFESFSARACNTRGFARDFLLFVFSAHVVLGVPGPDIRSAAKAYIAAAPPGVWKAALGWVQGHNWLRYPVAGIRPVVDGRELRALPHVLDEVLRGFAGTRPGCARVSGYKPR